MRPANDEPKVFLVRKPNGAMNVMRSLRHALGFARAEEEVIEYAAVAKHQARPEKTT